MTILLTGGTGFMGAWIVRTLVKKNINPLFTIFDRIYPYWKMPRENLNLSKVTRWIWQP